MEMKTNGLTTTEMRECLEKWEKVMTFILSPEGVAVTAGDPRAKDAITPVDGKRRTAGIKAIGNFLRAEIEIAEGDGRLDLGEACLVALLIQVGSLLGAVAVGRSSSQLEEAVFADGVAETFVAHMITGAASLGKWRTLSAEQLIDELSASYRRERDALYPVAG